MNNEIWNLPFVFGLVFTVIGILMLQSQIRKNNQCTEKTNGLIVRSDLWNREAALMLTFTANGENYRLPFSYSHKMSEGMAVTVVYDPYDISRRSCYILEDARNSIKMGIICIFAGIVFMLIGYGVSIGLFTMVWLV